MRAAFLSVLIACSLIVMSVECLKSWTNAVILEDRVCLGRGITKPLKKEKCFCVTFGGKFTGKLSWQCKPHFKYGY
ncbi:hypothetical protein GE061_013289 [Apolygus lucorum]|uniref:Uncharacterized protein n=1 Tax=Apolygus lucorum TaxID=248454 RepID=A0A6A4IQH1_APOLU|nr:hypothetical protein GE061_013289 [Apolygus lucorum]